MFACLVIFACALAFFGVMNTPCDFLRDSVNVDECQVLKESFNLGCDINGKSECVDGVNEFTCKCADGYENGGVKRLCEGSSDLLCASDTRKQKHK